MTTPYSVRRLHPPEVELPEPRTARKQKTPQVSIEIGLLRRRLRVLLSGQLSLLSLLELFFLGIGRVTRAGH